MVFLDCSCNGAIDYGRCDTFSCPTGDPIVTQKIIQNQVRAPASLYTMNIHSLSVKGPSSNNPLPQYYNVNWNQSSDRNRPHIQNRVVPTNGNSTRSSITRNRPGSGSPGGIGVDIKHNSYDRYLSRKKAHNLKSQSTSVAAVQGNKTKKYGMLARCNC